MSARTTKSAKWRFVGEAEIIYTLTDGALQGAVAKKEGRCG
jgi:hypothetical protein